MVGKLIILCELDHFIQHQHTVEHLAVRRGRKGGRFTHSRESTDVAIDLAARFHMTLDHIRLFARGPDPQRKHRPSGSKIELVQPST